jgi:hypothetical protein
MLNASVFAFSLLLCRKNGFLILIISQIDVLAVAKRPAYLDV